MKIDGVTDIKKWTGLGKPVVILSIISILLYYVVMGAIERYEGQEIGSKELFGRSNLIDASSYRYDTPTPVKAGTWSNWMPALDVSISISPSSAKVEYERMDALERVTSKEGKPNGHIDWNDTAVQQRIKSDVDLVYQLKRL
jgi:hypothetical protein